MTSSSARVTLAMPVYNGANFIAEAIESILAQTWTDFELIVTDNASDDETRAIVERFASADERVRYVRNERNIGAAANYNRGFELGSGEYIKWCAHDDRLSPNFLEACVATLDADPSLAVAFASTTGIDLEGNEIPPTGLETQSILSDDPAQRFREAITMSGTCFPIFGVFRRDQLERSTLHRSYYGSDRALLAEMAIFGGYKRVEEAIFYNREHPVRSINIDDKVARSKWQNGQASRLAAAEHINLARHLFEIAGRHGDIVSPGRLRRVLWARSLHPRELGRYGLELTSMVSPKLAVGLKTAFSRPHQGSSNRQQETASH
ncbi:glycosyltransferase family 2 protein [Henriciella aquimarina]|uniref:glycosyltransferase family 2 protein n=1 Tax=Henriciella aquimarina TaxID=545261 RepID=UPI0009FFD975|nr:glycosyltransferase family 2 protein [Henriciella aquimarina]